MPSSENWIKSKEDFKSTKSTILSAFESIKFNLQVNSDEVLIATEEFNFGFHWPAEIRIYILPENEFFNLKVLVSNFGFGPIQKKHCEKVSKEFINTFNLIMRESSDSSIDKEVINLLREFQSLKNQGIITEKDFQAKKKKLLDL